MPKSVSFSKLNELICQAVKEVIPSQDWGPWIAELFDDYAIVEIDDLDYWKIPYSFSGEGDNLTVSLSERMQWERVERSQDWIDKRKARFVKAFKNDAGEWILDVLGIPFGGPYGGKDTDGEYFDADTALWLEDIGKRAIVHYHGSEQDGKRTERPEVIGQELGYEVKEDGVWFRVLLDKSKEIAQSLWEKAQEGFVRASSGAISHLVRTDHDSGHIDVWPVGEISLMDISAGNYPANPYAVASPAMMSLFKAANLTWPDELTPADSQPPQQTQIGDTKMDEETRAAVANGLTEARLIEILNEREAAKAEQARIAELEAAKAELDALKAQAAAKAEEQAQNAQVKKLPNPAQDPPTNPDPAPQIEVYSKYDSFSLSELGIGYEMLKAMGHRSPKMLRAMHAKALKAVKAGDIFQNHVTRNAKGEVLREFDPTVTEKAVKALRASNPMQASDAVKADELHGSDVTDGGDEWVPTLWSAELWDLVRNEARVMSRFRQVEVMGESLTIPTLEGKTTLYKTAQTDDAAEVVFGSTPATTSKITTGNVTLTPVKNMAVLMWTGELDEDSIVPILPTLQSALRMDIMEQVDEMLISGDTDSTSANNSDTGNGSIAATWHLLSVNGLRDYALETSGKASDIAGAPIAEDFLTVMGLLGTAGAYALDPEKLVWFSDTGFYRTILSLGEVLTRDKYAPATIESGRITRMFGSDFIVSDKYGLTDANGQIHNTASNNTKGSFLCVRPDRWVIGFGRQIRIQKPAQSTIEMVADVNTLVASFRIDFKQHSLGQGAALGYNVTVL